MAFISDEDLVYDAFAHVGERRRNRLSAYYVCSICDNQFVYGVPLNERICPICMHRMHMVSIVDEFELHRMDSWSGGILRAKELAGDLLYQLRIAFFTRSDIGQQVKQHVLDLMRKESC